MAKNSELQSLHLLCREKRLNFSCVMWVEKGSLADVFNVLIKREGIFRYNTRILSCQAIRNHTAAESY